MYPVSNYLVSLSLFCKVMCLSLLSDTRMLNISLCLNISMDSASKWSKDWCPSVIPSLDLTGDRPILNENSLPISTTDKAMLVPSTGTTFKAYSAKNTSCDHWLSLTFSDGFIFWTLFRYQRNPSFLIFLWLPLATAYTGISKVSWKVFLNIPAKKSSESTTVIFGRQKGQRSYQNTIIQPGLMQFPSVQWILLDQILSYSPGMLEYCEICTDLWFRLAPKSLEIPC